MKTSPTQRSLAYLRKQGYTCQVVEHFNPHVRIRQDLFGASILIGEEKLSLGGIDVLAIKSGELILGVQTTSDQSGGNSATRLKKMRLNPKLKTWLETGHTRLIVHAWAKRGDRGKRKLWTCREIEMTIADFAPPTELEEFAREIDAAPLSQAPSCTASAPAPWE